jgi:hypothetical protein
MRPRASAIQTLNSLSLRGDPLRLWHCHKPDAVNGLRVGGAHQVTSWRLISVISLLAYYSNVVTLEKYTLDLAVIYVAMIIVGGMGSIFGALLGAIFITLLPFAID